MEIFKYSVNKGVINLQDDHNWGLTINNNWRENDSCRSVQENVRRVKRDTLKKILTSNETIDQIKCD